MKTIFKLLVFILLNPTVAQTELKLKYYKHIKAKNFKATPLVRVETDVLNNTFLTYSTNDSIEFEGNLDTGRTLILAKYDEVGTLKWMQKWKNGDFNFGSFDGIQPDNFGGIWLQIPGSISKELRLNGEIFKTEQGKITVIHFNEKGDFDKYGQLHYSAMRDLERGLNNKYYSIGQNGDISSFEESGNTYGKVLNPSYDFNYPEFAVDKKGNRAIVTMDYPGQRDLLDTIYKWNSLAHTVIYFDDSGRFKWHRLITNAGSHTDLNQHRMRFDNKGNLYISSDFGKNSIGKSGLFGSGKRAIVYKFSPEGKLLGEFYDTANIGSSSMHSEAWLYNDEYGRVFGIYYTFTGQKNQKFPGAFVPEIHAGSAIKIIFDTLELKAQKYFIVPPQGVPGSSMPASTSCSFGRPGYQNLWYFLPNGEELTVWSKSDLILMFYDSIGMKTSSSKQLNKVTEFAFPNPSNGYITINIPEGLTNKVTIEIVNLNGKIVYRNILKNTVSPQELNLNSLSNGLYYVRLYDSANKSFTQKLIIRNE